MHMFSIKKNEVLNDIFKNDHSFNALYNVAKSYKQKNLINRHFRHVIC